MVAIWGAAWVGVSREWLGAPTKLWRCASGRGGGGVDTRNSIKIVIYSRIVCSHCS